MGNNRPIDQAVADVAQVTTSSVLTEPLPRLPADQSCPYFESFPWPT